MRTYLIDTNVFITPKNSYYRFDFAKRFWEQLAHLLRTGQIIILDAVYRELTKTVSDDLTEWLKNQSGIKPSKVLNNQKILQYYADIFRYIQSSNLYKETALSSWANENIADAWLIAAARYYNRPIITLEKRRTLNTFQKVKDVKIPEVAEHFNVECPILFDVMRELNFDL